MDDLNAFSDRQRALSEMAEESTSDYESRLRASKRRRLWKPYEEPNSRSSRDAVDLEDAPITLTPPDSPLYASIHHSWEKDTTRKAETDGLYSDNFVRSLLDNRDYAELGPPSENINDGQADGTSSRHGESSAPSSPRRERTGVTESKETVADTKETKASERASRGGRGVFDLSADVSNITSPASSALPRMSDANNVVPGRRTLDSERKAKRAENARKKAEAAARKKEEEVERLMTPVEYAAKVQTKFSAELARTPANKLFLRGTAIFYIGGDYQYASKNTRNRMDFLRKKGATVVPTYDAETVTHIVTDTKQKRQVLKALGLKSLDKIPMHIPTVTWDWVTSGNKGTPDIEFMHSAFSERVDASPDRAPALARAARKPITARRPVLPADEFSRIEDFSVIALENTTKTLESKGRLPEVAVTPSSPRNGGSRIGKDATEDPLAEFYVQARHDREAEQPIQFGSEDESDSEGEERESRFTCDNPNVNLGQCINQDVIDKLTELLELHKAKLGDEERWRVFSYGKAIRAIRNYPKRIRSFEEAKAIKGVGEKTALKVMEIIKTGGLRRIELDNTEEVRAVNLFYNIYGVGPNIAYKWYSAGCRTLEDIRQRKGGIVLTPAQELGLKYYDDINSRIPRSEVEEIYILVRNIALEIDPKLFIACTGSYRRGNKTCGDVDIVLTRPTYDGKTHKGVVRRLLKELHLRGIITEDLALPEDMEGLEATYRGLCRRDESSIRRRIDILAIMWESRGAALIYYTGDDIFNRAIRLKAGSMGYSLNGRFLTTNAVRDPKNRRIKTAKGIVVPDSETEEDIFRILGVPWQEPHERIRKAY